MKEFTLINDVLYGNISFSGLVMGIVDSPQFQRLRFIKQLGITHFVYPSATHTRFEHSIGTAHLCKNFLKVLKDQYKGSFLEDVISVSAEDLITKNDIACVEIAGLCHDLGHGPFSHLFEKLDREGKWKHEEFSCVMFDKIVETSSIVRQRLSDEGLTSQDVHLIKQLILGNIPENCEKTAKKLHVKNEKGVIFKKNFLFQIVANKLTGIDCDKFDYLMRDSYHLGIKCNFDHQRYFQNCSLLKNEKNEIYIYPRDKELLDIYELFYSRWRLHRNVYQHKTTKAVEMMFVSALEQSKNRLKIWKRMNDPDLFLQLTDSIFYEILYSTKEELGPSKKILKKILSRDIIKLCGQVYVNKKMESHLTLRDDKEILQQIMEFDTEGILKLDDLHIGTAHITSGSPTSNPLFEIIFCSKAGDLIQIPTYNVSCILPLNLSEKIFRVYCGSIDGSDCEKKYEKQKQASLCFQRWCESNQFLIEFEDLKDSSFAI